MHHALVGSNNDGQSTSYVIEGATAECVQEAIDAILRQFHPLGYGTDFRPPEQQEDGSWKAWGSRSNSCD
jgi:hypothetical protein